MGSAPVRLWVEDISVILMDSGISCYWSILDDEGRERKFYFNEHEKLVEVLSEIVKEKERANEEAPRNTGEDWDEVGFLDANELQGPERKRLMDQFKNLRKHEDNRAFFHLLQACMDEGMMMAYDVIEDMADNIVELETENDKLKTQCAAAQINDKTLRMMMMSPYPGNGLGEQLARWKI
jgi:hypothetical protein